MSSLNKKLKSPMGKLPEIIRPTEILSKLHDKTHFKAATSVFLNHQGSLRHKDGDETARMIEKLLNENKVKENLNIPFINREKMINNILMEKAGRVSSMQIWRWINFALGFSASPSAINVFTASSVFPYLGAMLIITLFSSPDSTLSSKDAIIT
jgi:hypothetical protein